MKKLFLVFSICTCLAMAASAQFQFGPQVGFNYATLTGTSDITINPKPEWHAGLLFDLGLAKHFSIQPSLLYSRRGYKYDYQTSTTSVAEDTTVTSYLTASVDASLGYLDIPVLLNIYFGDHRGFMLNAGPQLSILMSNQSTSTSKVTTSTNGGTPQTTQPETETKFKFNPSDVSLIGGIGYKFPRLLLVYLRASTGFGKVQSDHTFLKDGNEGHNFTIEAGAALTFGAK